MKLKALIALAGCLPLIAAALQTPEAPQAPQAPQESAAMAKSGPICSGGDDTAALQAMLSHGNPEMTVVEIPATPTGCLITGPLFVYSNTHVIQNGLLTLNYNWPPTVEQRGMYTIVDNAHDIIIEGSGVIDGGDPVYTTPTTHCCMGGIVSGGPVVGADNANVRDITVRGLTVRNVTQWGVALTGGTNLRIDGVTVYNTRNSSGVGFKVRDAIVTNSRFYNILDVCFSLYRGVEDSLVSSTIVDQCQGGGISVFSDWADCLPPPLFSRHIVLNNNIAIGQHTTGTGGIDVLGNGLNGDSSGSASITFSIAHSHELGGIGMAPVRGGLISGNLTHDHGPAGGWSAGINLLGAKGVLVSGNSSFNQGYGTTTGLGLHAGTFPATPSIQLNVCGNVVPALPAVTIERLAVLDNYYYDANTAAPTMLNAFKGSSAYPVVVAGNTYAPMIGVADDFSYLNVNSVNTDNDAQP